MSSIVASNLRISERQDNCFQSFTLSLKNKLNQRKCSVNRGTCIIFIDCPVCLLVHRIYRIWCLNTFQTFVVLYCLATYDRLMVQSVYKSFRNLSISLATQQDIVRTSLDLQDKPDLCYIVM